MALPSTPGERIELPGATVALDRAWLRAAEATAVFEALLAATPWESHRIRVYGRWLDAPRLSCWIGDVAYRYSGTQFDPIPWPAVLVPIRARLQRELGALFGDASFNSVLANLYRDGNDRLGFHRDSEAELGPTPLIASISLGATRRFRFRSTNGARTLGLDLGHGSLLVMSGDTQMHYQHAVPPTARAVGPRINLTFRRVTPRGAVPAP